MKIDRKVPDARIIVHLGRERRAKYYSSLNEAFAASKTLLHTHTVWGRGVGGGWCLVDTKAFEEEGNEGN